MAYFLGEPPGYPRWLASHPDGFVVTVERQLRAEDIPRRSDGDMDFAAIAKLNLGPPNRALYRATCQTIRTLGDGYNKVCGTRDEIDQRFKGEDDVQRCQLCL